MTHPAGKSSPDEPSGEVAVKSDSALSGPAEGPKESDREAYHQTMDFAPDASDAASPTGDGRAPPAAFGRYRVRHALGDGGFGTVYRKVYGKCDMSPCRASIPDRQLSKSLE